MDFRFSQFEILTAAGTLLICLYFVCVFTEISAIEGELAEEIGVALDKEATQIKRGRVRPYLARESLLRENYNEKAACCFRQPAQSSSLVVVSP